jgi:hypothetical protein
MMVMGAALAEPTPAPAGDVQNDLNRIVCKSTSAPTGTRLGAGRTCRTQREWDEIRKQDEAALKDLQTKGLDSKLPGGGG